MKYAPHTYEINEKGMHFFAKIDKIYNLNF